MILNRLGTHQNFVDKLLFVEKDDLAVKTGHFVTETIDPHVEAEFPSIHDDGWIWRIRGDSFQRALSGKIEQTERK